MQPMPITSIDLQLRGNASFSIYKTILILLFGFGFCAIRPMESFALPVVSIQPIDTTVEIGGSTKMWLRHPRSQSPSIQWKLNGDVVPGGTSADLIITNADFLNAGIYTAVLTDMDGSVTSNPAILNLLGPIDPPFDPGFQIKGSNGQFRPQWKGEGFLEEAESPVGPWKIIPSSNSQSALSTSDLPTYYRVRNPQPRPTHVFIPTQYDPKIPVPLLIALHGYTGSPSGINGYFDLQRMAERHGFLLCAPAATRELSDGNHTFWNATNACCNFYGSEVDDVAYLTSLIQEISQNWNVDAKRIHLIGHSNGGFMAYRLAAEKSHLIASMASLAGATYFDPEAVVPKEPVAILQIHGTNDAVITYENGIVIDPTGKIPISELMHPGALQTIETWAAYNGCEGQVTEADFSLDLVVNLPGIDTKVTRYTTNPAGGAVELWSIIGGSHGPTLARPDGTNIFSEKVVGWLLAHPKP